MITSDRGRKDAYSIEEFNRKLQSLQSHVLSKLFSCGLRVVARSDSGRLHCHAAVALGFATDGFDWRSFDEAERWYKLYKSSGERATLKWYVYYTQLYRASMPEQLRDLNHTLVIKAKKYGFGRIFILPIRKNSDALKWYLVGNIPKKRQKRDAGVHFFTSWGLAKTGKFKTLSRPYNDYRDRLKLFAEGLHLTADNYNMVLRTILGNNWHWKCRDYIKHIAMLPEGLFLPPCHKDGYEELRKTIKQHLVRTGQYEPNHNQCPRI